ncbi:MAG: hypothetical protein ACM3X7_14035 [Solirubrobacterales bacterium]
MTSELENEAMRLIMLTKDDYLRIRLSKDLKKILRDMAKVNKMSMNSYVEKLVIDDYLEYTQIYKGGV